MPGESYASATQHELETVRAALVAALDDLLRRQRDIETISPTEIAAHAGLPVSAFHHCFANKMACAVAVGAEFFTGGLAAFDHLYTEDLAGPDRIRRTVEAGVVAWREHRHLFRAMVRAAQSDAELQETWSGLLSSFVEPVADWVRDEREAGRATPGADPVVIANLLMDLSNQMILRLDAAPEADQSLWVDGLVEVWSKVVFGPLPAGAVAPSGSAAVPSGTAG